MEEKWSYGWVRKTFGANTFDKKLEEALFQKSKQDSVNQLFGALNGQKDADGQSLNLGTIENLLKLIEKNVTAQQFTSLFGALNGQKDADGQSLNLGTIENFMFLFENEVKDANDFKDLTDEDRKKLRSTKGCSRKLAKIFGKE